MCRIAGIISNNNTELLYPRVKAMCTVMQHGGPDDEGIYLNSEKGIAIGHRRLSLLDPSQAGHQPMPAGDAQLWISYNGEVYNFKEIRSELEALGHLFKSGTDTEVILKAYLQWGTSAFAKFNGMFAFALADLREDVVFLVRDSAGIKPLYYSTAGAGLTFASEVRAFKESGLSPEQNENMQLLLLAFGHIPEPYTTLKNVFVLPKGHYLSFHLSGKYKISAFRRLGFTEPKVSSKSDAIQVIQEGLRSAVKRHLVADAPIGLFLSGGIDSSLLTLLAAEEVKEQLHTLSVTFSEEKYSEKEYQQAVIDKVKCKHRFYNVTGKDLQENLDTILRAYDQPSNDAINSWFISKCAKENGLKAVLSGLGSDEIFGGYPSFQRMPNLLRLKALPATVFSLASLLPNNKLQRLEWLKLEGTTGLYLAIRGFFTPFEIASILEINRKEVLQRIGELNFQPEEKDIDSDEYACWLECNRYMQNQLLKDSDYMSMQHGLELRVPFLDQSFLDTVFSIDRNLLYKHKGIPKQLLVDAFKDILPEKVWNRPKMGFAFPFQHWLGKTEQIRQGLATEKHGQNLLNSFDKGDLHWSKLWTYYLAQNFAA